MLLDAIARPAGHPTSLYASMAQDSNRAISLTCPKRRSSGTGSCSSLAVAKDLRRKPSPSTTTVEEGVGALSTKIRHSPAAERLGGAGSRSIEADRRSQDSGRLRRWPAGQIKSNLHRAGLAAEGRLRWEGDQRPCVLHWRCWSRRRPVKRQASGGRVPEVGTSWT